MTRSQLSWQNLEVSAEGRERQGPCSGIQADVFQEQKTAGPGGGEEWA